MKKIIIPVFILIAANTFSQKLSLEKLWASDGNLYFTADKDAIRFETFYPGHGNIRTAKKYLLVKDTLRLFQNDFHYNKSSNADFLITLTKKEEIFLTPIDTNAALLTNLITLTGVKKELRFTGINKVYTDTIRFEKIIFNSTSCYGYCPDMTLRIDNNRQVQFTGGKYAVKQGSFTSGISSALLNELIEILKVCELDKIESNNQTNIDAPTYTMEIHYNKKIKYLKSCMLPFVTGNLLQYLLALPGKLKLVEANNNIDIKFSNN